MGIKKKFGRFFGFSSKEESEEVIQEEVIQNEETVINEASDIAQTDNEEVHEINDEEMSETPESEINDKISKEAICETNCETSEVVQETAPESENTEQAPAEAPAPEKKKGFFARLKDGLSKTRDSINSKIDSVLKAFKKVDEELFEELEEALIMADVGVDTSLYIISELRKKVKEKKITETEDVKGAIEEIIAELLMENDTSLNMSTNPCVIMVIGVNGVGKTTSIGKMASRFKADGKKVILGAADTFRAAAIDQLQIWADRSGVDIIKHQEGSDPASVVFDTIAAAKSRGSDVIILDTAGRLHNKKNLMDELAKISRIIARELPGAAVETLLVLDATTGQNAVNQAKLFAETSDITGLILTKLDGSAKGGIVLAIAHEQKVPVKLVGVGEGIDDLQDFSAEDFAKALF
ncbi:MAG: signal recognition particle-docking protein FtsY [Clostridia bacterium]|nr:signal recognition particle-docking protein FtsY [Clostridia bacterium]